MFINFKSSKPEVNAQLEKIEAAASEMKKAFGDVSWMHRIEVEVSESGVVCVGNEHAVVGRRAIVQLEKACAEYEAAVEELAKIQA